MTGNKGFSIIVAVDKKLGIGRNGTIPWNIPSDKKWFKQATTSTADTAKMNCCIMGRTTWESIPEKFRPLPGRLNIIVSGTLEQEDFAGKAIVCKSLDDALQFAYMNQDVEKIFVTGGKRLYDEAQKHPDCKMAYVTVINHDFNCDVKISDFSLEEFDFTTGPEESISNNSPEIVMKFCEFKKKDKPEKNIIEHVVNKFF